MTNPLDGHVALVTGGAGRGIGRAAVLALARDGADVAINTHRSHEAAEAVAEQVRALGRRAIVCMGDVSDPGVAAEVARHASASLGQVDVLVASAGGLWRPRPIEAIPVDEYRGGMAEEIDAVVYLAQAVLPAMRAAGWGRIVTVGGFDADDWRVPPEEGPLEYAMGKAARHWLVRTLARQEAQHGVTVNAVAPGPVTRVPLELMLDAVLGRHALEGYRAPTQVEVAEAIAWLVRQRAVTGTILALPGPEPGAVSAT